MLDFGDATIMPGLVDAHIHLALDAGPDPLGRRSEVDDEQLLAEMRWAARQALMAGVTTVRDLDDRGFLGSDQGDDLADPLLGADVVPAGPPLTSPQGHCWSLGGVVEESGIRAAVREHARGGADVIEVMVTGGEMTPGTDPTTCQFSLAALNATADEAHRQGLMITGHAHGAAGILAAVEAGFDGIEHASFATPDGPTAHPAVIEQLAASNITVTVLARAEGGHRYPRARGPPHRDEPARTPPDGRGGRPCFPGRTAASVRSSHMTCCPAPRVERGNVNRDISGVDGRCGQA